MTPVYSFPQAITKDMQTGIRPSEEIVVYDFDEIDGFVDEPIKGETTTVVYEPTASGVYEGFNILKWGLMGVAALILLLFIFLIVK